MVNQEDCGNPTNIGRVEKFVVNPISYDGNKCVSKHVGHMCVCMYVCMYERKSESKVPYFIATK